MSKVTDKNNLVTKYTYDSVGNLIKKQNIAETTEYVYNLEGKLSSVKKTEGSTVTNESYSYNAFGTRIKKVTNGEEERYLVDEYTSYSRVLEEKNKNNNLTATYTYGHELISQNRATSVSFYNRDGLGSTTSLTNVNQTVTDTYSYDSFGNLINSTGTTKNNYLFAGEEKDNTTGYYYLRARYMDTTTGRFTSMDSYLGSVDDPVSLHKYLYANANPVNYIDPSGYFSLAELMEVVKTQGVLSGIEYLNVNTYLLYIKLESSAGGIIIKAVLDESFETLLEGNISLESIKWSAIEAIWKMAGVDVDLSVPKMIAESSESGNATVELSQTKIEHVLKNHTFRRMKGTIDHLMEKGLKGTAENLLNDKSFFNSEWSEKEVTKAVNYVYNEAVSKGITNENYTTIVSGEKITVCFQDGRFHTTYGEHKFVLSDFGY